MKQTYDEFWALKNEHKMHCDRCGKVISECEQNYNDFDIPVSGCQYCNEEEY